MQMVATLKQYSAMRNISVYRLRHLAKNGVITAGIVGNKYLLNVEAVDRYFEELRMKGGRKHEKIYGCSVFGNTCCSDDSFPAGS